MTLNIDTCVLGRVQGHTGFGEAQVEAQPTEGEGQRMRGGAGLPAPALHLVGNLGIAGCRDGVRGGVHCTPHPSSSLDFLLTPSNHHPALLRLTDSPLIVIRRSTLPLPPKPVPFPSLLWIMPSSIHHRHHQGSRQPPPFAWIPVVPGNCLPCLQFYPLPIHSSITSQPNVSEPDLCLGHFLD